jgi:asparagine synthase (glutamine-hydrolysing)
MSAQAGIFYFDGRPIEPTVPKQLQARFAEFGPDGCGEYTAPGLVMVHRSLHVTPEDRLENQPYVSARGNVMTWDGRLDNREDLLLQLWRDLRDDTTDVAIAMAAYEQWGEEGFRRLVGDWSLVLWNRSRQDLTLASDFSGNRGLFYSASDRRVVWSSSLGVLVGLTERRPDVDIRFVVGYLTCAQAPAVTPYKGVAAVPPAHSVMWTRNGASTARRFWDLSIGSRRYLDPKDYEVQLRLLVRDAIRARLRSIRPVWAELSGGFDSSAVVCMAAHVLHKGPGTALELETVSYFTRQSPASNELRFIEAVEQQCGLKSHRVSLDVHFGSVDEERQWITPLHPSGVALREYQIVQEHGGHVLLSGAAGDAVLGNFASDPTAVVERLRRGHLVAGVKEARAWSRASERPIWGVIGDSFAHLARRGTALPAQVRATLKRRGIASDRRLESVPAEAFLLPGELTGLWLEEMQRRASRMRAVGGSRRSALLESVLNSIDTGDSQSSMEFPRVHYSLPLMHRPLVEFVLALPPGVLFAPGEPRALMKRALGDILPPRIVQRISKGYVVEPFRQRAVRTFAANVTHAGDLHVVRCGYVDERRLSQTLEAIKAGGHELANLRQILKLEKWLAALNTSVGARPGIAGSVPIESAAAVSRA